MFEAAAIAACLVLGTDTRLIEAIIAQESAGRVAALNINRWSGPPIRTPSIRAAVAHAEQAIAEGYSVDMGLMGINSQHLQRFNETVFGLFTPCRNIAVGERILQENLETARRAGMSGQDALRAALSLYNTGTLTRGLHNGYVDQVLARLENPAVTLARQADSVVPWTHPRRPVWPTGHRP